MRRLKKINFRNRQIYEKCPCAQFRIAASYGIIVKSNTSTSTQVAILNAIERMLIRTRVSVYAVPKKI